MKKIKKSLTLFLIAGVAVSTVPLLPTEALAQTKPKSKSASQQTVSIPDKNLQLIIRDSLKKPKGAITKKDMERLKTIYFDDEGGYTPPVKSLKGIEYAVNVTEIYIDAGSITDVSPLKGLKKLQKLSLSNNRITDVSPLKELPNLTDLDISGNRLRSTNNFASLKKLQVLRAGGNPLTDVVGLKGLHLKELYLGSAANNDTKITDLNPLKGMTTLTKFELVGSSLVDIRPLSTLSNLEYLNVNMNQITDPSPLRPLKKLKMLSIGTNKIKDTSFLEGMTNMDNINLQLNQIEDINVLLTLPKLTYVDVGNNPLNDNAAEVIQTLKGKGLVYVGD